MAVQKGKLAARANGDVRTPSRGPRAKAVGVDCGTSKYPKRGTDNPVK